MASYSEGAYAPQEIDKGVEGGVKGAMKRYPWPASGLGTEEMKVLYDEKIQTRKPITELIREAIIERYGRHGKQRCRVKTER